MINDGRVIIDSRPEPWEPLDLTVLIREVPNAEGGWFSSSEAGSAGLSGFARGSGEVDIMVAEVGAGMTGGVVI